MVTGMGMLDADENVNEPIVNMDIDEPIPEDWPTKSEKK
jgi:hypothetical protein